ncbi:CoA transferase [Marivivens donghaensis]|uniref:CoA transferase n=1 Tax=Marivivens donghaensis TaxID=1699413 RepID=UPI00201EE5BE|nr:CoA transferase [Marivivens donghaensis]MCL7409939.1 CoA transferase [Marivivens donghaensis]MDN3705460.1 CoA transferase [Marivivens donghaensis]
MTIPSRDTLPLAGVKVIDFGQYIAGPAVAMILGDLGATVVHIDPPGGPMWQSPANATLNRNKMIVTIDLKSAEGVEQAKALIAEADIVVENFRPGKLANLGIDFAELRQSQPDLITVSIPGFASADEERRELRAYESVIAASSGVFTDMGLNRVLMGVNPSFSPLPLASSYGAMMAASAAVLALQARERTGLGDQIEVPLASAVMEGLCYNSIKIDGLPERYITQREQEITRRRTEGLPMNVTYEELQELLDPFYRSYLCKDGRMFYVVCPSHKTHAKRCLQTLGIYDDLVAEGLQEEDDTYKPTSEWSSDVSLGVYPLPKFWADKIAAKMKEVFITRTAKEWERIFGRNKFPGAPQRWLQEWINDDHAETSGLMIDVEDPEYGMMIQPGPVVWLEESGEAALYPIPRRWVDVSSALAQLKKQRTKLPRVTDPNDRSGWLEGVRVLDLCNVIAGPHSVSYLARFGAEVIKLDPSKPMYDAWNTVIFGMSHMRGKKSVLTDITSEHGRKVFENLVRSVDVIVWNAPDNQIKAMGLDADNLARLNPDAIFCKLDCFSGVRRGPRTDYVGYDDLVQATTGIMLRFGGLMSEPEEHAHVGTIDVMCGFGGALGVATALYQKLKTGKTGRGRTSLSANSGLLQVPFCYDYTGRGLFDEPSGRYVNGYDALSRFYYTASGEYLLLSTYEKDIGRLEAIEAFAGLSALPHEEREGFLAGVFANDTSAAWLEVLRANDIGAAVCDNIDALRAAYVRTPDGTPGIDRGSYSFSVYEDHPSGHTVTQLDPFAVRPTRSAVNMMDPAEKYGASTRSVLLELGYNETDIDVMLQNGSISETWSKEYLPS